MTLVGSWWLQLGLALGSLPWLVPYHLAFRVPRAPGPRRSTDVLYNLGFLLNLTWGAMLFCPQPRLPGLFDRQRLAAVGYLPVLLGGALIVGFTLHNVRAMAANEAAVRRAYARPAVLLREGPYARVRNPMNTGGLFVFLGLAILLGATTTLWLFPLYFLANHAFTVIEERGALFPSFGEEFAAYRAAVPCYFAPAHLVLLAVIAFALAAIGWRCPPVF